MLTPNGRALFLFSGFEFHEQGFEFRFQRRKVADDRFIDFGQLDPDVIVGDEIPKSDHLLVRQGGFLGKVRLEFAGGFAQMLELHEAGVVRE